MLVITLAALTKLYWYHLFFPVICRHLGYKSLFSKYMKPGATSLVTSDMQVKPTVRYHFTYIRLANLRKSVYMKYWCITDWQIIYWPGSGTHHAV